MKKSLLILFLAAGSLVSAHNSKPIAAKRTVATCVGDNPCKACKNCKYCKRCAKDGNTCGVCKK
ncbi:hypothetical protein ABIB62_003784 [Mucilaginibacter sp. UYP25]|uniref:hypothetical protein n=1 Tax=unclassified Mucilaginibacter TaxID=2617802 RepID=UPI003395D51D